MTASSSAAAFFGLREEDQNQHSSAPNSSTAPNPSAPPQKKRRNQPGNTKSRCRGNSAIAQDANGNKQVHMRGLQQRVPERTEPTAPQKRTQPTMEAKAETNKEVRRKVYLCPEPTCVHHEPSRALGDLTGIKKHYSRKHGEKKYKCEKCSKKYAVQSDWKAHTKTCGTREYRCDCGTLFSRRDSFITHRAFCDALAQESARHPPSLSSIGSHLYGTSSMGLGLHSQISSAVQEQNHQSSAADILHLGSSGRGCQQFDNSIGPSLGSAFRPAQTMSNSSPFFMSDPNPNYQDDSGTQSPHGFLHNKPFRGIIQVPELQNNAGAGNGTGPSAPNAFNFSFFSGDNNSNEGPVSSSNLLFPNHFNGGGGGEGSSGLFSGGGLMADHMNSGNIPSLYNNSSNLSAAAPHMSATALLQKAAQMGSTSSSQNAASLLKGFGTSNTAGVYGSGEHGGSNNFHDLMNSLGGGSSSIFGGHETEDDQNYGVYNANKVNMEAAPVNQNHGTSFGSHNVINVGGSDDRLTRDFLGVGEIVRSMSGGMSQRENHQLGIDLGGLDSERKTTAATPKSQSFWRRRGQFSVN